MIVKKYALIDVGSRTVKLSVFAVDEAQTKLVLSDKETVNLAEGLYPDLKLLTEPIRRTVNKIAELVAKAAETEVWKIRVVSTGAARKASNSADLIKGVYDATGIVLEIISGEQEAELFYHGVVNDFPENLQFAAINVGGGSTEISLGSKEKIDNLYSLSVGVSALNEEFLKTDPPTENEHAAMMTKIKAALEAAEIPAVNEDTVLIHTGGELDYVQRTNYRLDNSDLSPSHPKQISLVNFVKRSEEIRRMTKKQLHEFMPENPCWMEGAIACNAIAQGIAEHLKLSTIVPSDKNLNDGLLLDLIQKDGGN